MTLTYLSVCFLSPLFGSLVGYKLFELFDSDVVEYEQVKHNITPQNPEDMSTWNYSQMRLFMSDTE